MKKKVISILTSAMIMIGSFVGMSPAYAGNHQPHFKGHISLNVGFCAPHKAVRRASRHGIHQPRIVFRNRHKVIVKGYRNHRQVHLVFANWQGCPIIR